VRRRTAQILSFYSERCPANSGASASARGALGRVAWRVLVAAGERGDQAAVEAVWRGWLRHQDDARWELLCRWRSAPAMAAAAFAAAVDPARPEQSRVAIGAFCSGHGLAPAADAERALFCMLTGQHAQQRAADPDGSALAAAYQAAGDPVRAALRQAMAGTGGLDLVRVIAARGADGSGGGAAATECERAYLAAELARRRDWARLWRLALDFPLPEAVAAARLMAGHWRPADQAGQQLFARLAATDPVQVGALAAPQVTRIRVRRQVNRILFAPDGSEVAVASWRPGEYATTLHALPGGHPRVRLNDSPDNLSAVHLGPGFVFTQWRDRKPYLMRFVRGHGTETVTGLPRHDVLGPKLAQARDGFVVAIAGSLLRGTAEWGSPLSGGTVPGLIAGDTGRITHIAAEPRTGQVAVVVYHGGQVLDDLVVLGPDLEITGRTQLPGIHPGGAHSRQLGFCGPHRLVIYEGSQKRIHSLRVGPSMTAEATTVIPDHLMQRFQLLPPAGVVVISPPRRTPGAADPDSTPIREYLDAQTLRPAACPAALDWARELRGWLELSPDGRYAALSHYGRPGQADLEIRDLIRQQGSDLVRRPLAQFRPAGLAALTELADGLRPDGDQVVVAEGIGLLQACLEYRFAADVAIGNAAATEPGITDIALGGGEFLDI
jgi:hypothetical protein